MLVIVTIVLFIIIIRVEIGWYCKAEIKYPLELNLKGQDFLVKLGRESGQNLKWENNLTKGADRV